MSGGFVGRDVFMEYAIAKEDAVLASLTFQAFGMLRGKSMKVSWETADTTADKSPGNNKTKLVTFKDVNFSGDGVSYTEAVHNQQAVKAQSVSPGPATDNQPKIWFRMTGPDGVWVGPFIVTEWSDERPYAEAATWSIGASSNGDVSFTPA
jgi:predicted secreted protein